MNKTRPSTTEQVARHDERLKAIMDKLEDIHDEVKKTNGRVTSLEGWRSEIKGSWRATVFLTSITSSVLGAAVGYATSLLF